MSCYCLNHRFHLQLWASLLLVEGMNDHQMQGQSRFYGAPATKWLLIVNAIVFLLDIVGGGALGRLTPWGCFVAGDLYDWNGNVVFSDSIRSFEWWRLLTFQFLHGDEFHLLFNMLGIYMFGGIVERVFGTRRFMAYYLLCGIAGGLFYYLLMQLGVLGGGFMVGASAGIFGILVALIIIAPDMRVMLLFPPIPMKMKTMGMVFLAIAVFKVVTGGTNAGGEAGHLGGMILGFILMKNPSWLNWVDRIGSKQKVVRKPQVNYQPKLRPRTRVNFESTEVDRILDKVSREGIHSLTEEEKATLKRVSESDE